MAKADIYQQVTDQLIAALEAGASPWRKSWNDETGAGALHLPRRANGEFYRGINTLLLWGAAEECGFKSDRWFTFKQAEALGAQVRKGSTATKIIFYKSLDVERTNDAGETVDATIPMIRQYCVFNADQIDGLPERFTPAPVAVVAGKARDELNESALRSTGADIREGGVKAYYSPAADFVQMPTFDRFDNSGAYLATLAHELCHWTGHTSRLDRSLKNAFGSKDYASEELIAEIGSAFVGARLGIVGEHIDNHAAYLAAWLKVLKEDKRAIFKAASAAQRAADLVLANAGLESGADAGQGDDQAAPAPAPAPAPILAPCPMPAPAPVAALRPAQREKHAELVKVRASSPMRSKAPETACTAGLGLFDFVDQPRML